MEELAPEVAVRKGADAFNSVRLKIRACESNQAA